MPSCVTNISITDYSIPEIDFACFDNIQTQSLSIVNDISYNHIVVLADIDISANVFKKIFYDLQKTTTTFNTFTNSYFDYFFSLLPTPPTAIDVLHTINGKPFYYYKDLSYYISLLTPTRRIYRTDEIFSLQDEILNNIISDLRSINPKYEKIINTCSFIDFNKEVTNLKTLNDIIPSSSMSMDYCALDWSNILELVRCEYNDTVYGPATGDPKYAILSMTLIFKTTININMADIDYFVSTSQVKLRYRINFDELAEFQT